MDSINIKQLAKKLNLSVSTVSKAFRKEYDINPQTRERILAAAKEYNYHPNPIATSLRTQRTKTIAVVIPEIDNSFFVLVIKGIEAVAQEQGYHVLIYLTHQDYENEVTMIQNLQKGRVDGVLMSLSDGTKNLDHLEDIRQRGLPLVFFDRVFENDTYVRVTTNDYESGFAATEHLIERGCKKIAHLYLERGLSISKNRMKGYFDAIEKHGSKANKKIVLGFPSDTKEAYQKIRQMLLKEKPDGIFSSFEKLAMLCYKACEELELRIPEDVKIISFSNLEIASLLNPSLSTITQPAFEIGKKAAELLFEKISGKTYPESKKHVSIESIIIPRKSTESN